MISCHSVALILTGMMRTGPWKEMPVRWHLCGWHRASHTMSAPSRAPAEAMQPQGSALYVGARLLIARTEERAQLQLLLN